MKVLVRTDGGGIHGLGHMVRMRALAQELAAHGCQVAFASNTPESLAPLVAPFSCTHIATVALQSSSRDYSSVDAVIIDTKYPIEEAWYRGFGKALGGKIVRIDHPHATPDSCDVLVGPCVHWSPETVNTLRASFGERCLYGWDYVMLAPEVTQHQPIPYEQRIQGPIVFCAGGSDPSGALATMAQWCGAMVMQTAWLFLMSQMSTEFYTMQRWGQYIPFDREHLRKAALVVSLFGITPYECIYYQTPTLMLAHTAENHIGAALLELATPAVRYCSALSAAHGQQYFCETIQNLWAWEKGRTAYHHAAAGLIDGLGTERVAEEILRL